MSPVHHSPSPRPSIQNLTLTRRGLGRALLGASALAVSGTAVSMSAAPARAEGERVLASWGSSSLAPHSILDHVGSELGFDPVVHYARPAQTSIETLAMRGGHDPLLDLPDGMIPGHTDPIEVTASNLRPEMSLYGYEGWVDDVFCRLDTTDHGTFMFHRVDPGEAKPAVSTAFRSEPQAFSRNGCHVYWMGKNDLTFDGYSADTAIENTQRAWDVDGAGADGRVLVLGYWRTFLDDAARAGDIARVNGEYATRFGPDFYLDVQHLLTDPEWGLSSPPVAGMGLQPVTAPDGGLQPPRELVGDDNMHLNDLGNQVVAWAITEKMRDRWGA